MKPLFFRTFFLFLLIFFLSNTALIHGQNERFHYQYDAILLDSTIRFTPAPEISGYLTSLKEQLAKEMDIVIANSSGVLTSYVPASPLSNLLTDLLYQYGNRYCMDKEGVPADLSLLNFGGIRNILPAGNITVGDVFKVLPFENTVVIISLKGSELKKVFNRFTEKNNQPYSQVQIRYHNGVPFTTSVQGEKIDDQKLYRLVTINFIETGGDGILRNINFEKVLYPNVLVRDVIIEEIKRFAKEKGVITPILDDRVIIDIQY